VTPFVLTDPTLHYTQNPISMEILFLTVPSITGITTYINETILKVGCRQNGS
jgi:hypothetical protein